MDFLNTTTYEPAKAPKKGLLSWMKSHINFSAQVFAIILVLAGLGGIALHSLKASTANRNKPLIYQGRLTDENYVPVADGVYNVKFSIYDAASGGTCLWATGANESSGQTNCSSPAAVSVTVSRGLFTVQLGDDAGSITNMAPMNLDFNTSSYYLGMTVGSDSEMTPRVRIGSSPYAYNADELDGLDSSQFLRNDVAGTDTGRLTLAGNNQNLAAYWKMDETGGNRSDVLGVTTLTNHSVGSAAGKINNAASFVAASSQYLSAPDNTNISTGDVDFTISAWVYLTSKGEYRYILSKGPDSASAHGEFELYYSPSDVFACTNGNGTTASDASADSLGSPALNTWYFIVCSHDATANTISIQVNNGPIDTFPATGGLDNNSDLHIGTTAINNHFWDGRIDSVAIWKRTLSAAERSYLYNSGLGNEYHQGTLLVNPSTNGGSSNNTILGLAVGGSQKFRASAVGNIETAGTLTVSGLSSNSSNNTIVGNLLWPNDNQSDIGAAAGNRVNAAYFGTSVVTGITTTSTLTGTSLVGSGAFTISSTSSNLTVSTSGSGNIIMDPVGNVGVGLTSPTSTFHIRAGSGESPLLVQSQQEITLFTQSYEGSRSDTGIQTHDGGFLTAGDDGNHLIVTKYDSEGNVTWAYSYAGAGQDIMDSYYGSNVQEIDGGYIIGGYTTSFGVSGRAALIIRLNSDGGVVWANTYGSGATDTLTSVKQTPDGGFIFTAATSGFFAGGYPDGWVTKISADGVVTWSKTLDNLGEDYSTALDLIPGGGYIVAEIGTTPGAGGYDARLSKLDSDGNMLAMRTIGGAATEYANSVFVSPAGDIYMAGFTGSFGSGNADCFVTKFDSSLSYVWGVAVGDTGVDNCHDIYQDSDGNVLVAGEIQNFGNDTDAFAMKLESSSGAFDWATIIDEDAGVQVANAIRPLSQGGYVVTGYNNSPYRVLLSLLDSNGTALGCGSCYFIYPTVTDIASPSIDTFNSGSQTVTVSGVPQIPTVTPFTPTLIDLGSSTTTILDNSLFTSDTGLTGINTDSPIAPLDISGLTIGAQNTGTIGGFRGTTTFTKNDSNTRTFSVAKILPTFNFGGSNSDTTVNIVDIDSVNTATTGLTSNLVHASYGGAEKMKIDSSGTLSLAGKLLATSDNSQNIGSSSQSWSDLHVGGGSSQGLMIYGTGTQLMRGAFQSGVGAFDVTDGGSALDLQLSTGTNNGIFIDFAGRIGINTVTPTAGFDLDTAGNLRVASTTILNGVTYTWPASDGTSGYVLTTNGSGTLSWGVAAAGGSDGWSHSGSSAYLATSTDKVGIGTTSPIAKLAIEGGALSIGDILQAGRPNEHIPQTNSVNTIDSTGNVGRAPSLAIGADGLPVIAYYDGTNQYIKVAKCNDMACAGGDETITSVANYPISTLSIAIGTDGFPVISFQATSVIGLYVTKCNDSACTSSSTTAVDTSDNLGQANSIAIGTDGFPVISYGDDTNNRTRFVKCGNASCSSGNTFATLDTTDDPEKGTSIAIGIDGFPVVSEVSLTTGDVHVTKCGNASCSSGNTTNTVESTLDATTSSITISNDGFPIVVYTGFTSSDVKVFKCSTFNCSSGTATTVDSTSDTSTGPTIAMGTDGLPIISYFDFTNGDVKTVKCGNPSCSSGNTTNTVAAGPDFTADTASIRVGSDGLPLIAYYDNTANDLKTAKCGTTNCTPYWTRR